MPIINWYPGHIAKAERKLKELANLVDIVIVLVDARIPLSSHYKDIKNLIGDVPQLLLLNKADLADPNLTSLWKESYESQNYTVLITDCTSNKDVNNVIKHCYELGKTKIERLIAKGRLPRPVRVMIVGMPNVGKSSLVNRLVKFTKTKVGPKAGVTKTMQWVRINPKVELLDTPGIIPMKLDDQNKAINLAIVNSVSENAYDIEEVARELLIKLWDICPDRLIEIYSLENSNTVPQLEEIAISKKLIGNGNKPDILRTAQKVLSDFRAGKIGRITLERSPKFKIATTNII